MTVKVGDHYQQTVGYFKGAVYVVAKLDGKTRLVNMKHGTFWHGFESAEESINKDNDFVKVKVDISTTEIPHTRVFRINKEYRDLLQLAIKGRYWANNANDQRLASQRDVYGAFYCAWKDLIYKIFPEDIAKKVVDMDVELWNHANICNQISNYCQTWLDDVEVEIEAN